MSDDPKLMPLIGARLVRTSAPSEAERFQEGLIKELTSGQPTEVRAVDDGVWRLPNRHPDFRPIGEIAAAEVVRVAARCGHSGVAIVASLRGHGAVRTLSEIWAEVRRPLPELELTLAGLEVAGLVRRRELDMGDVVEPCWWSSPVFDPVLPVVATKEDCA